jgi:hypothetical protein
MSQRVAIIAISLTCVRGVPDLVVEMLSPAPARKDEGVKMKYKVAIHRSEAGVNHLDAVRP